VGRKPQADTVYFCHRVSVPLAHWRARRQLKTEQRHWSCAAPRIFRADESELLSALAPMGGDADERSRVRSSSQHQAAFCKKKRNTGQSASIRAPQLKEPWRKAEKSRQLLDEHAMDTLRSFLDEELSVVPHSETHNLPTLLITPSEMIRHILARMATMVTAGTKSSPSMFAEVYGGVAQSVVAVNNSLRGVNPPTDFDARFYIPRSHHDSRDFDRCRSIVEEFLVMKLRLSLDADSELQQKLPTLVRSCYYQKQVVIGATLSLLSVGDPSSGKGIDLEFSLNAEGDRKFFDDANSFVIPLSLQHLAGLEPVYALSMASTFEHALSLASNKELMVGQPAQVVNGLALYAHAVSDKGLTPAALTDEEKYGLEMVRAFLGTCQSQRELARDPLRFCKSFLRCHYACRPRACLAMVAQLLAELTSYGAFETAEAASSDSDSCGDDDEASGNSSSSASILQDCAELLAKHFLAAVASIDAEHEAMTSLLAVACFVRSPGNVPAASAERRSVLVACEAHRTARLLRKVLSTPVTPSPPGFLGLRVEGLGLGFVTPSLRHRLPARPSTLVLSPGPLSDPSVDLALYWLRVQVSNCGARASLLCRRAAAVLEVSAESLGEAWQERLVACICEVLVSEASTEEEEEDEERDVLEVEEESKDLFRSIQREDGQQHACSTEQPALVSERALSFAEMLAAQASGPPGVKRWHPAPAPRAVWSHIAAPWGLTTSRSPCTSNTCAGASIASSSSSSGSEEDGGKRNAGSCSAPARVSADVHATPARWQVRAVARDEEVKALARLQAAGEALRDAMCGLALPAPSRPDDPAVATSSALTALPAVPMQCALGDAREAAACSLHEVHDELHEQLPGTTTPVREDGDGAGEEGGLGRAEGADEGKTTYACAHARPSAWTSPTTSTEHTWDASRAAPLPPLRLAGQEEASAYCCAPVREGMDGRGRVGVGESDTQAVLPAMIAAESARSLRAHGCGKDVEHVRGAREVCVSMHSTPLFKYRGLFDTGSCVELVQLDQPLSALRRHPSTPLLRDSDTDTESSSGETTADTRALSLGSSTPTSTSSAASTSASLTLSSASSSDVSDLTLETLVRSLLSAGVEHDKHPAGPTSVSSELPSEQLHPLYAPPQHCRYRYTWPMSSSSEADVSHTRSLSSSLSQSSFVSLSQSQSQSPSLVDMSEAPWEFASDDALGDQIFPAHWTFT
jgi:hypothetical protein